MGAIKMAAKGVQVAKIRRLNITQDSPTSRTSSIPWLLSILRTVQKQIQLTGMPIITQHSFIICIVTLTTPQTSAIKPKRLFLTKFRRITTIRGRRRIIIHRDLVEILLFQEPPIQSTQSIIVIDTGPTPCLKGVKWVRHSNKLRKQ